MNYLLWLLPLLLLSGCAYLPTTKAELDELIAVTAAGTYTVDVIVTKDQVVLMHKTEIWDCTQENGKLSGCHKRVK